MTGRRQRGWWRLPRLAGSLACGIGILAVRAAHGAAGAEDGGLRAPLGPRQEWVELGWTMAPGAVATGLAGWVALLLWRLRQRRREASELEARIAARTAELEGTNASLRREVAERARVEADLREGREALRASQQRFLSAFSSSPAVMTLARLRDGALFEVNEAFLSVTGFARDEVLGRSTVDLGIWVNPADREAVFRDVGEDGHVRGREVGIRLRDGRERTFLLAAELVEIDGEPSILSASLDVTERRAVEEQLRRALAHERELGELKSNFVSLVSHEFRTPLEVILSSAEILERYHDRLEPGRRAGQVAAIRKAVRRMAEMMDEVLLLGRFEAGRVELTRTPLDLRAFQGRMGDEVRAATGGDVTWEFHADGDLEGATGDESLLGHVFTNLLSNAVKYSPPGVPVGFGIRREGRDAVFEVSDRGCGIPESDQARLFQSFRRGSNVGSRSGTGLGLVIVKRCVERHGGTVAFTSSVGAGTTFTVRLPLFEATGRTGSDEPGDG